MGLASPGLDKPLWPRFETALTCQQSFAMRPYCNSTGRYKIRDGSGKVFGTVLASICEEWHLL
jgi:hypothetical protein